MRRAYFFYFLHELTIRAINPHLLFKSFENLDKRIHIKLSKKHKFFFILIKYSLSYKLLFVNRLFKILKMWKSFFKK